MGQFMMMLHGKPPTAGEHSPEEMQAVLQKYQEWSQKMGAEGKLAGGNKLAADSGKVLREPIRSRLSTVRLPKPRRSSAATLS